MKKHYDDEQEDTTACRVRNLRLDKEWSQKELADKIFVATLRSAVWKAEKLRTSAAPY